MKTEISPLRFWARLGFVVVAWLLVVMVFVQVFHAGYAVHVSPGEWERHVNYGHSFSLPIMVMVLLGLVGGMGYRMVLLGVALYVLYSMQYIFLFLPRQLDLPVLTALHPVNALAILLTAVHTARTAWPLVMELWAGVTSGQRVALVGLITLLGLGVVSSAMPNPFATTETSAAVNLPSRNKCRPPLSIISSKGTVHLQDKVVQDGRYDAADVKAQRGPYPARQQIG